MKKLCIALVMLLSLSGRVMDGQDLFLIDSLVNHLDEPLQDTARFDILLQIAEASIRTDTLTARKYLERARGIALNLDDRSLLGDYYRAGGMMQQLRGNYQLAIMEYDRALACYSEAEESVGYFTALKDKGSVYLYLADYTQAMNHYQSALEFFRRNEIADGISRCLNNIGIIHKNRGEYREALTVYDESIKYLDREEDAMEVAQGYINMGNVFVLLGRYEPALEYYDLALHISEKEGSKADIALCLANSGVVQNKCGHFREALNLYRRALKVSQSINDPVQSSNCLINIGTNYADMGQTELAKEYVNRGMAVKIELGDEKAISNCHIYMAEIAFLEGDLNRAITLFNDAIPQKQLLGDREGLVRCYLGLSLVMLERKNYEGAAERLGLALQTALEMGALEHIAEGYRISSDIAVARGDYRSAYDFATLYHKYRDSLIDETTSQAVIEMEFRNHAEALQQENENLRIQSELASELMKEKNAFLYSIIGIAVLLAAGLILVIYFLRRLRISSQRLEEKNLVITKQNLKLDALNRNKDRMMSIIAHDLRGTIGNQITATEILFNLDEDVGQGIDRRQLLANLKHSASYSLELLENLLHWSRLEENESHQYPEEVELNTLVTSCVSLFSETAGNKDLTIHQKMEENIRCKVDRIMMETIIRNLLSNAIKFSERGGTIEVIAEKRDGWIDLRVTDQGIGMSEEQVDKVMSNGGFTRRGTANEKGAGIGLTLVREFTSMHGGKINISTRPGRGSTFQIAFPSII